MKTKSDARIERRIVTGLILSTEYIEKVIPLLKIKWLKTQESKRITSWCLKYFKKFKQAPKGEIQNIYLSKMESLDNDVAGLIEDTLSSLSKEFKRKKLKFNVEYLFDETEKYLKKRQLQELIELAQEELDNDDLLEATLLASNFTPIETIKSNGVVPLGSAESIRKTYEDQFNPLFNYGNTPLGGMLNRSFCRGCFVSILAQNKLGKSFWLMDFGMKAIQAGCKVAFFQAGDMSREQQERRQGIWLTKKSDLPEYCNTLYIPTLDCVYNQNGECNLKRESTESPFDNYTVDQLRGQAQDNNVTQKELKDCVNDNPKHKPCYNCLRGLGKNAFRFKGTIWYNKRKPVKPLIWKDVYKIVNKKWKKKLQRMRLVSYSTDTLTVNMIKQELNIMEKQGFIADVVLIDYIDLLAPDTDTKTMSLRDQENMKWKRMRSLSLSKNNLIITPTQADAKSFNQKILNKTNFSEDKRKLDHCTAMYGLNMTEQEKKKGVSRINDLVSRDTEGGKIVHVMQRLQIGRPVLGSFY